VDFLAVFCSTRSFSVLLLRPMEALFIERDVKLLETDGEPRGVRGSKGADGVTRIIH